MKELIKNIFAILETNERRKLRKLIFLDLVISVLDIAFLGLMVIVIHYYSRDVKAVTYPFIPAWVARDKSLLLIAVFLPLFCLKNLAGILAASTQFRFVYDVASRISQQNLRRYLNGTYGNYVETDSSVHIRQISQEPIEFGHYVLSGLQQIISNAILIILTVIAILLFNVKLFFLLIVLLLPPVMLVSWIVKKRLRSARQHAKTSSEKSLQHLQEALSGYVESNVYDKTGFFIQRYYSYQKSLNRHLSEILITQAVPSRLMEVFAILGFFILLVANRWWTNQETINLVTIGAFLAAAYKIIPSTVKILNLTSQMRTYSFTISNLLAIGPTPKDISYHGKDANIRSIEFKSLGFQYADKKVLKNLNLKLNSGEILGISGISGKGKTTLINCLLGFLEPDHGEIMINQVTVNAKQRNQYWKSIAYVKQQTFLIHDTILNNIVFDENGYDPDLLNDALQFSGLNPLIQSFPEGLKKIVTENGKNISGGQRQRIALARALYKKADLLILDEPFNELDESAELEILRSIKNLVSKGKIVILITHNPGSLALCDKIISLDEA